ncbi:actin-related protein Arp6 [Mycena belliarum]|uniref:Actin-like protein ARP6 n=1 Tax=Mycena belliarum TaxID=1033014 RepID=A0AAD6UA64_9AGAR|nr:actin-related protein Arp6 [Mycena belliae]
MTVIVFDNGGSTIKAGIVAESSTDEARIITNAVVRSKGDKMTYVGHELDGCKDYSALNYRLPLEKGYIVDWDAQKAIWDGILSDEVLNVNPTDLTLLVTEPYFNLPKIQEVYDQFIFEEYEFKAYFRCTSASLIPHGTLFDKPGLPPPECMLIVDSGFSFTHVVPLMDGKVVWTAVKRLDVGGKLLTNQLKELVSFRQWNMMDETYIMNHVKETCCFVTQDFKRDLETCRSNPKTNAIVQEYVLPDLTKSKAGKIREPDDIPLDTDQVLTMANERFTVPEIIFRPDDIGLERSGLAETIATSISLLPDDLQGMFWANVGLVGGNTKLPGFRRRLTSELQALAPVDCDVGVYQSADSALDVYRAAVACASAPDFPQRVVTRAEYLESGSSAVRRKFPDWQVPERDLRPGAQSAAAKGKGRQREESESAGAKPTRARAVRLSEPQASAAKGKGRQREEPESAGARPTTAARTRTRERA